jgi:hypothetical protein
MIKSYFKFLFFICLFSINAYSQKKDVQSGDPNDLDQKFIPDKNSILNSTNSSSTSSRGGGRIDPVKNIFKFNLALLGRSTASIFYEHPFGKVVSVEAGLGLCYNRDFMQNVFSGVSEDAFDISSTSKYLPLSTILTNSIYSGSHSVFLSGAVKLYVTDDAPEGGYISFNMRYYSNSLLLNATDNALINNGSPATSTDVTVRNLGFNIVYGYQFVGSGKNVSVVNDFYIGFGMRRSAYDGITTNTGIVNPNTGSYQTLWVPDGSTQTSLAPVFLIGYCLGFGF